MKDREFPVFLPMGSDRLFGVVCAPPEPMKDLGVVLLTGGNYTRIHRNRMWVRTARALAERGFASIRFDYHGIGDSTGRAAFDLDAPFDEDALAAAAFLKQAVGVTRTAMVATCFGGRTAMAAAARDPATAGVTLFATPVLVPRDRATSKRQSRLKSWVKKSDAARRIVKPSLNRIRGRTSSNRNRSPELVSRRFKQELCEFLSWGDASFVYGERTEALVGVKRCLTELETELGPEKRSRIHLEVLPGADPHRFRTIGDQDLLVTYAVSSIEQVYERLDLGAPTIEAFAPGHGTR